jgi:hypothetical protein
MVGVTGGSDRLTNTQIDRARSVLSDARARIYGVLAEDPDPRDGDAADAGGIAEGRRPDA